MRKLNIKAKLAFNIFAGVVVLILAFFAVIIYTSANNRDQVKEIGSGSIVYKNDSTAIHVDGNSEIRQRWDNTWELSSNDNIYPLGETAVVYEGDTMLIFGGGYQIYQDGSTVKLSNYHEASISDESFFKIDDRKYLQVAETIQGVDGAVDTSGYLYYILDKSGNASILNQELNVKTTETQVISSSNFAFDTGNEVLYFEDSNLDLTRVLGTSSVYSEYQDRDYQYYQEDNQETIDLTIKGGNGGQGGTGGNGGTGGTGGTGGSGGAGGNGGEGLVVTGQNVSRFSMRITDFALKPGEIEINYKIANPDANFTHFYLDLYGEDVNGNLDQTTRISRFSLNPDLDHIVINNFDLQDASGNKIDDDYIKPGRQYKVELKYKKEAESSDIKVMDSIILETPLTDLVMQLDYKGKNLISVNVSSQTPVQSNLRLIALSSENQQYVSPTATPVSSAQFTVAQLLKPEGEIVTIDISAFNTTGGSTPPSVIYIKVVEDDGAGGYTILEDYGMIVVNNA